MDEHNEMESPIDLIFYKVIGDKEVDLPITVNGEENIALTGEFIGAHRAENKVGAIVWQGQLH